MVKIFHLSNLSTIFSLENSRQSDSHLFRHSIKKFVKATTKYFKTSGNVLMLVERKIHKYVRKVTLINKIRKNCKYNIPYDLKLSINYSFR